jgi:hypothetical protein
MEGLPIIGSSGPSVASLPELQSGKAISRTCRAASELLPQESDNFPRFVAVFAVPHRQSVPELCLQDLLAILGI